MEMGRGGFGRRVVCGEELGVRGSWSRDIIYNRKLFEVGYLSSRSGGI